MASNSTKSWFSVLTENERCEERKLIGRPATAYQLAGGLRQDSLQKDCTSNDHVIIVMKLAMGKCLEEEKRPIPDWNAM